MYHFLDQEIVCTTEGDLYRMIDSLRCQPPVRYTGQGSRPSRTLLAVQQRQSPTPYVAGRVRVRVVRVAAGHTSEARLALPRRGIDVPARVTGAARVRGGSTPPHHHRTPPGGRSGRCPSRCRRRRARSFEGRCARRSDRLPERRRSSGRAPSTPGPTDHFPIAVGWSGWERSRTCPGGIVTVSSSPFHSASVRSALNGLSPAKAAFSRSQ